MPIPDNVFSADTLHRSNGARAGVKPTQLFWPWLAAAHGKDQDEFFALPESEQVRLLTQYIARARGDRSIQPDPEARRLIRRLNVHAAVTVLLLLVLVTARWWGPPVVSFIRSLLPWR